jgi:hypothetical protein
VTRSGKLGEIACWSDGAEAGGAMSEAHGARAKTVRSGPGVKIFSGWMILIAAQHSWRLA